ncbi:MAG: hypothetical protein F4Y96_08290, partial [Chloroflexi bacterium]|nr:hypothetical protein [Chloroflexota bacterium]
MADQILAYSDRIMQDNVITATEGEQLRERDARLDRQLQTTSTAEQRCDDAKQRVQRLEDALRRIDVKPTATATPRPTPTPRPTATPSPTPTATPAPAPTPTPIPPRYQVFYDDMELLSGDDTWERLRYPELLMCIVRFVEDQPETSVAGQCKRECTPAEKVMRGAPIGCALSGWTNDNELTERLGAENELRKADFNEHRPLVPGRSNVRHRIRYMFARPEP